MSLREGLPRECTEQCDVYGAKRSPVHVTLKKVQEDDALLETWL